MPLVPVMVSVEVCATGPKNPPPHPANGSNIPRTIRTRTSAHKPPEIRARFLRMRLMANSGSKSSPANQVVCLPLLPRASKDGVCTESTVVAPVLPGVTVAGLNDAVAPAGKPVTLITTGLVKFPLNAATSIVNCTTLPFGTLPEGVVAVTPKSVGTTPAPVSVATCGEPAALSATLTVAE